MKKTLSVLFILAALLALLFLLLRTPDLPLDELKQRYTNASSQFMPIAGMEVHYRDEGPRTDSLPILLLHGTASSLHTWDSLVALLPQKRCIRLDLPGYGLTGPHPQGDYRSSTYSLVFDTLLQRLGVEQCIVAGNSLGGFLTWTYALDRPQVKGIVLVDPGGFTNAAAPSNIGFVLAKTPGVNRLVKYITPRSLFRKSLEQSYGNPQRVTDELVQRHYELTLRPGNRQAILDRFSKGFEVADTNRLRELSIPALVLWGDRDRIIPPSHARLFTGYLPQATLVVYPGLGHVPMEEKPERVAAEMNKWMK
ncbi:MAG TPA: alpha/beta hydrolase [Lacibacter sp.]|nr:alpha/beta hydrolase [Lacibacter sp.]HMO90162.1 alpha/beta hydrolase [Lacibacter sp.]